MTTWPVRHTGGGGNLFPFALCQPIITLTLFPSCLSTKCEWMNALPYTTEATCPASAMASARVSHGNTFQAKESLKCYRHHSRGCNRHDCAVGCFVGWGILWYGPNEQLNEFVSQLLTVCNEPSISRIILWIVKACHLGPIAFHFILSLSASLRNRFWRGNFWNVGLRDRRVCQPCHFHSLRH